MAEQSTKPLNIVGLLRPKPILCPRCMRSLEYSASLNELRADVGRCPLCHGYFAICHVCDCVTQVAIEKRPNDVISGHHQCDYARLPGGTIEDD